MTNRVIAQDIDIALVPAPKRGWEAKAACRDKDPELWFGDRHSEELAIAKAVCLTCPVIRSCASFVLFLAEDGEISPGTWASVLIPDHNSSHLRDRAYRELFGIATGEAA